MQIFRSLAGEGTKAFPIYELPCSDDCDEARYSQEEPMHIGKRAASADIETLHLDLPIGSAMNLLTSESTKKRKFLVI